MSEGEQVPVNGFTKLDKSFFLPVGIPLQIEINDVSVKMNSMSVGYLSDTCLIIKYPNTGGFGSISNKLYKGNRITVRYISNGNVFGFQSDLIGVATEPVRLLFLEYPKSVARHSLRATKRVGCYLPADLVIDHMKSEDFLPEVFQGGIVEDISESGCNYRMIKDFPDTPFPAIEVGDAVALSLRLPGSEKEFQLLGDVRRVEKDLRKASVGIQFREVTDDKKRGIIDYISTVEKFLDE